LLAVSIPRRQQRVVVVLVVVVPVLTSVVPVPRVIGGVLKGAENIFDVVL